MIQEREGSTEVKVVMSLRDSDICRAPSEEITKGAEIEACQRCVGGQVARERRHARNSHAHPSHRFHSIMSAVSEVCHARHSLGSTTYWRSTFCDCSSSLLLLLSHVHGRVTETPCNPYNVNQTNKTLSTEHVWPNTQDLRSLRK